MKLILPRPPAGYDQADQAHSRRLIAQAMEQAAGASQLGFDTATAFAGLPPDAPPGSRFFVFDRGAHGKPVWRTADGTWVDGAGSAVT